MRRDVNAEPKVYPGQEGWDANHQFSTTNHSPSSWHGPTIRSERLHDAPCAGTMFLKVQPQQHTRKLHCAYKNAARKAPRPTRLPAATLATAAPVVCEAAPVPVGEPLAPVLAPEPLPVVGVAPDEVAAPPRTMVVLLLALTTRVCVPLTLEAGPPMMMV